MPRRHDGRAQVSACGNPHARARVRRAARGERQRVRRAARRAGVGRRQRARRALARRTPCNSSSPPSAPRAPPVRAAAGLCPDAESFDWTQTGLRLRLQQPFCRRLPPKGVLSLALTGRICSPACPPLAHRVVSCPLSASGGHTEEAPARRRPRVAGAEPQHRAPRRPVCALFRQDRRLRPSRRRGSGAQAHARLPHRSVLLITPCNGISQVFFSKSFTTTKISRSSATGP